MSIQRDREAYSVIKCSPCLLYQDVLAMPIEGCFLNSLSVKHQGSVDRWGQENGSRPKKGMISPCEKSTLITGKCNSSLYWNNLQCQIDRGANHKREFGRQSGINIEPIANIFSGYLFDRRIVNDAYISFNLLGCG